MGTSEYHKLADMLEPIHLQHQQEHRQHFHSMPNQLQQEYQGNQHHNFGMQFFLLGH